MSVPVDAGGLLMNRKIEYRNCGKQASLSFFAIVILISVVVETLICRGGSEWLYLVLMWIPAMAAAGADDAAKRQRVAHGLSPCGA